MTDINTENWCRSYVDSAVERLRLAFGSEFFDGNNIFPSQYVISGVDYKIRLKELFKEGKRWDDITPNLLTNEFGSDYIYLFPQMGWRDLYRTTPLIIQLAYTAYFETSDYETIPVSEKIFCLHPTDRLDCGHFVDWLIMFTPIQIVCVMEFMAFMRADPLKTNPGIFVEGHRWWAKYYVGGMSGR